MAGSIDRSQRPQDNLREQPGGPDAWIKAPLVPRNTSDLRVGFGRHNGC